MRIKFKEIHNADVCSWLNKEGCIACEEYMQPKENLKLLDKTYLPRKLINVNSFHGEEI